MLRQNTPVSASRELENKNKSEKNFIMSTKLLLCLQRKPVRCLPDLPEFKKEKWGLEIFFLYGVFPSLSVQSSNLLHLIGFKFKVQAG